MERFSFFSDEYLIEVSIALFGAQGFKFRSDAVRRCIHDENREIHVNFRPSA